MNELDWVAAVRVLASNSDAKVHDLASLSSSLYGLWHLLNSAPATVQRSFDKILDETLESRGNLFAERLGKSLPLMFGGPSDGVEIVTEAAACLLRGFETALFAEGFFADRTPRIPSELLVTYDVESGYVLPFPARFREPKPWPRMFARRGLARYRCIPQILSNGLRVDLKLLRFGQKLKDLQCVAHLFEGVTPLDAAGNPIDFGNCGHFIFHGLNYASTFDADARLASGMISATENNLHVFPELTVPLGEREVLRKALQRKLWLNGLNGPKPALVVGGSWHIQSDSGDYFNCSPVYDGDGRKLGCHHKHQPYSHGDLVENIKDSDSILVLASDEFTVAISICLDFCQSGDSINPYDELDVDLVLVTSMGGETTMKSHSAVAKRIWDRRKTSTLVCQQRDGDESDSDGKLMLGYVGATSDLNAEDFATKVFEPTTVISVPRARP
jgi:hypothetical protein